MQEIALQGASTEVCASLLDLKDAVTIQQVNHPLDGAEKYVARAGQVRLRPLSSTRGWTYLKMKIVLDVKKSNEER